MTQEKTLLIQYAELLCKHRSTSAKPVKDFFDKNRDDVKFIRRAKMVNKLFQGRSCVS
jgi:hypothetical protein